ncbi:hypothetical protein HMPREF9444_01614 [Succinatimonas hippei YIT 12066]|uniref:Uncharacterized protein n=1 Tax=Succinatimonas hippei (strain DSM 22608 / JCM 16073 / KCTC 15190 / YIT 12066) TaxID=762983 RepID=E8LLJ8_SUCHY|nr:hypothetical protein HMPREF9444_01614 [Succinatimonas hippei YIT 12066]
MSRQDNPRTAEGILGFRSGMMSSIIAVLHDTDYTETYILIGLKN